MSRATSGTAPTWLCSFSRFKQLVDRNPQLVYRITVDWWRDAQRVTLLNTVIREAIQADRRDTLDLLNAAAHPGADYAAAVLRDYWWNE